MSQQAARGEDKNVNVELTIIKKSTSQVYQTASGDARNYISILANTKDGYEFLRDYKGNALIVGSSYRMLGAKRKPNGLIYIVGMTKVMGIASLNLAESDNVPLLPEDEPVGGQKRTLKQALLSPTKSKVTAKVAKVGPVKMTRQGTLPVRTLGLKDVSGYSKVTLFERYAEAPYEANQTLEISEVYSRSWNSEKHLALSKGSKCQSIQPCANSEITISAEDTDHFHGADFVVGSTNEKVAQLTIAGVYEAVPYFSCANKGCHKKKIQNGVCPVCEGEEGIWTYRAKIGVLEGEKDYEIMLFENKLQILFGKQTEQDASTLFASLCDMLPITFQAVISDNKRDLFNIQKL